MRKPSAWILFSLVAAFFLFRNKHVQNECSMLSCAYGPRGRGTLSTFRTVNLRPRSSHHATASFRSGFPRRVCHTYTTGSFCTGLPVRCPYSLSTMKSDNLFFAPFPPLSRDRLAIASSSVLVYPLHRFSPAATGGVGWPSMAPFFETLAAALPSLLAWTMAVWGGGQLRWGVASGLSVGLFTACLALKTASFAQACVPLKAAAGIVGQQTNQANDGGHNSKLATSAALRKKERESSGESDSDRGGDGRASADAIFVKATSAPTDFDPNLDSRGSSGNNTDTETLGRESEGDYKGGNTPIDTAIPTPTPAISAALLSAEEAQLTFAEFLFFLLAAPSLVCEPRFLKASARHPPRITRAASEFFHAGLTFLALHAACSALVAPTFRVLATASACYFQECCSSSCDAGGEAGLGDSDWVDGAGWAGLKASGSGWWLYDFFPGDDGPALGGGDECEFSNTTAVGWVKAAAAVAWGLFVVSPLVHFAAFYGFWHCVCLGCAELWGYPDRNLYGEISKEAFRTFPRDFHSQVFYVYVVGFQRWDLCREHPHNGSMSLSFWCVCLFSLWGYPDLKLHIRKR